jgi:hypothetical protein
MHQQHRLGVLALGVANLSVGMQRMKAAEFLLGEEIRQNDP